LTLSDSARAAAGRLDHVYQDSERLLDSWRSRYRARPALERRRLWLLALEREQLVGVAYRERAIAQRVARMPLDRETRHLIRRALIWVWQDEEMHAAYVRGVLLHSASPVMRGWTYGEQLLGAISGWASATDQHLHPRDHPVAVGLARALTLGGLLTGRLSNDLRRELDYGPFRKFCRLNVELERSATLCWSRIVETADTDAERAAAERIVDDERRHGRVFAVLAAALGDDDRLRSGWTRQAVVDELRPIGEWFLPRCDRGAAVQPGRFATGAPVFVERGAASTDKRASLRRVLDRAGLAEMVAAKTAAAAGGPVRAAVKTAFMLGYDRHDHSTVVDPVLVEELARYLAEHGVSDVAVLEAPTLYDRYFGNRSVEEVSRYFGYESPAYRVVDCSADQVPFDYARGTAQSCISRTWSTADLRVVLAKLRTNPSELGHLCLSSLEGLGERQDRYVFSDRQLHYRTATMMVVDAFEPDLGVVDAFDDAAQGPFGVMGCRHPVSPRRIYAGADALSVDTVVLRDMGVPDPLLSPMVRMATYWFDAPEDPPVVVGDGGPIAGFRHPYCDGFSTALSAAAYPVYVYGSGAGRLFVPAMDERVFPPLARAGPLVAGVRRAAQLAFGLRPPAR
ncbi:MAG TPA: DUF362 domain-containing protein, partial [Acidimicrobiales bacterium]|nr:DUF362 domain-containing protein [Acidimicrobiales bacterium]